MIGKYIVVVTTEDSGQTTCNTVYPRQIARARSDLSLRYMDLFERTFPKNFFEGITSREGLLVPQSHFLKNLPSLLWDQTILFETAIGCISTKIDSLGYIGLFEIFSRNCYCNKTVYKDCLSILAQALYAESIEENQLSLLDRKTVIAQLKAQWLPCIKQAFPDSNVSVYPSVEGRLYAGAFRVKIFNVGEYLFDIDNTRTNKFCWMYPVNQAEYTNQDIDVYEGLNQLELAATSSQIGWLVV